MSEVSGKATALADNVAALNSEHNDMNTVRNNSAMKVGAVQPTSRMSLHDLMKMETQAADFEVDATSTIGTVIYKTEVNPLSLNSGVTTRVQWLSQMFRYWNGTLHFKFIFTKTILQQTKFLAVFVPNAKITDSPPTPAEAYFYSHKMVMNPANETEVTMSVPFVSDRPYLEMTASTGVFYFMVYQPIVASFDTSTTPANIFVKVFNSADLELHETVPLPDLNGPSTNVIDPEVLWVVSGVSNTAQTLNGVAGATMKTDSGANIPVNVATGAFGTVGKPVGLANLNETFVYNRDTCLTLSGIPIGIANARFAAIQISATKAVTVFACSNVTGTFLAPSTNASQIYGNCFPEIVELAADYSTDFIVPALGMEMDLYLNSFGITMEDLKSLVENRLRAHGNDHELGCQCSKCWDGPDPYGYAASCESETASNCDSEVSRPDGMDDPCLREQTFEGTKFTMERIHEFVNSGFRFKFHPDTIECVFCGAVLSKWLEHDNVDSEHLRLSPDCKFICDKLGAYDECGTGVHIPYPFVCHVSPVESHRQAQNAVDGHCNFLNCPVRLPSLDHFVLVNNTRVNGMLDEDVREFLEWFSRETVELHIEVKRSIDHNYNIVGYACCCDFVGTFYVNIELFSTDRNFLGMAVWRFYQDFRKQRKNDSRVDCFCSCDSVRIPDFVTSERMRRFLE